MEKVKKALIPLILLLIIFGVGLASYLLGSKSKIPQASPSPSPSPTQTPTPTPAPKATKTPTATPSLTSTPTATPTPIADLYISEYSFDHPPKQGEAFTVKIGIYNQGNKAAGGFWWEWWATTSAPSYACRQRIDSLAAHGGRIVYCTYTYGGWANYTTKAIADVGSEIPESDEGNNTHSENVIPIH